MRLMDAQKPFIIAGPCSVESREQLNAVVSSLAQMPQVSMVRCGVWKPRTRPGGFEGLGEKALRWISDLTQKLRAEGFRPLPFACEVATPQHVELVMRYGLSAVWIGARTTANPFMVQELTEAIRGTGLTVLVKNAPSPDVRLWMGAIERCRQVGLSEVIAVHRGFDVLKNGGYRNHPLWEVPIELRRVMPDISIVTDPSHIAGRRELLQEVAQWAMDLGFDGLMLEVHPHPDEALTDGRQQITPEGLKELLGKLVLRQTDGGIADKELRLMRGQIDRIDDQLLRLLASRLEVSGEIARVKAQSNLAVFQPKRWESLLQQRLSTAEELHLEPEFVKGIFEKIHAESVRVQQERLSGAEKDVEKSE